jgi:hypothetical protein
MMRRSVLREIVRPNVAVLCCALVLAPDALLLAQDKPAAPAPDKAPPAQTSTASAAPAPAPAPDKAPAAQSTTGSQAGAVPAAGAAAAPAPKIPNDKLDSLVAPIALYPDALLAQVLVATTYPLELVQLQQWLGKNKELKDKALADAVAKQPWDVSIQSMAAFPDVVKRLVDDIQWATDMGNAFLSQQGDVMDSVQRMRKKAQDKGALKSNEQMKVKEEKAGEPPKEVIIIESSNPEVIYVPSYAPTVVYGPPVYPYPPIYYPPYPAGGMFLSFSIGVMWGAAIWGGSCCGCGWGGNDVNINVNNNFNRNNINNGNINSGDIGSGNRGQGSPKDGAGGNRGGASSAGNKGGGAGNKAGGGSGKWEHNPQHRGGTPYADKSTANKFGGDARGDSLGQRQAKASGGAGTGGGASAGNMSAGGRGGAGGGASAGNKSAGGGRGGAGGGGGDKVGSRDIGSSSGRSGGFGGGSGGYSGSSARASSSRGSSSMGSRGGGSRGGGGGGRRR